METINGGNATEERRNNERRGDNRRGCDRRVDWKTAAEWKEAERRLQRERRQFERRTIERRVAELPEGLYLLNLPQALPGFRYFISSWFFVDALGRRVVVDPGPASTIPLLINRLSRLTESVDFVLLTHIHLDHAGGIAQFCEHFKGARVWVHPKARRHLLDPEKLWKGSLRTLGDIVQTYGQPQPLNPNSLMDRDDIPGITCIETPGHAPHHVSFIVPFKNERLVFLGEAGGLYLPLASSPTLPYLRPTTPPKFDCVAAQSSIQKIGQAVESDDLLCYAHWGAIRRPHTHIALAKGQLDEWLSLIFKMKDQTAEDITDYLLENDSLVSGFFRLPHDLQERERFFINNSVQGFLQYFREN